MPKRLGAVRLLSQLTVRDAPLPLRLDKIVGKRSCTSAFNYVFDLSRVLVEEARPLVRWNGDHASLSTLVATLDTVEIVSGVRRVGHP